MRTVPISVALALLTAPLLGEAALASSSDWQTAQGGSVRLVTIGSPDESGIIRGALEINLKPGWKTYWLDPGGAGVPPTIDVSASSNIASAEMSFPAPRRFDDGFAQWAGYDAPVSFPIAFALPDAGKPARIEASVFLGICETICIPFQATLTVDPASDPENEDDTAIVNAALAALPGEARPDFGVTPVSGGKDALTVEATFAGASGSVDFFLAGSHGYQFGPPERREDGPRLFFSVPILERPDKAPHQGSLRYTLTSAEGAVTGTLPFPQAP